MNCRYFFLMPFREGLPSNLERVGIKGSIMRCNGVLSIRYELSGPLESLSIPQSSSFPVRKKGLWEETCFEFFLARKDTVPYWEINLSPAGDWNVYYFSSYRQGMKEEDAFASLQLMRESGPGTLRISLHFPLDRIGADRDILSVGVSAVLKTPDGGRTYWALAHPFPQADFHRREGFVLEL